MDGVTPQPPRRASLVGRVATWGPGVIVMLADTDAGNVVTSAQSGAAWGYRLLPLLLLLIPVLYMVQELTVRLGLATGRGYGELIRARFGPVGRAVAMVALVTAVIGSLVTEFTGIAGIGEVYGIPRALSLLAAATALLVVVGTGSYRRVERTALAVGLFELAFFAMAWVAHPSASAIMRDVTDLPLGDSGFLYLAAAIVGAVFNPWMIFYQQSSIADKKLGLETLGAGRLDTACGAVLTQGLTAAILVAVAAAVPRGGDGRGFDTVAEISRTLSPFLGGAFGRAVFGIGVLGASAVAAIVCSLALAWGAGELTGHRHDLENRPFSAGWFYGSYAACVTGAAVVVATIQNLVWLNVTAQILNALLLPFVLALLVMLAVGSLPDPLRLKGAYLALVVLACALVVVIGGIGVFAGLV